MIYEPCVGEPITEIEIDRQDTIIPEGDPIHSESFERMPPSRAPFDMRQTTTRYATWFDGTVYVRIAQRMSELP